MSANHATHPNRKQQILALSADLLREKGFSGFSYQDLAKALGINKASVHHHYPQKEDLGLALCDWTEQWLQQGFDHFDASNTSALAKLNHYLATAARHTFSEQKLCPVSALNSELTRLPVAMQQRLAALASFEQQWIEGVISAAQQDGELKPMASASEMAQLFIHSCKGALFYGRLHHHRSPDRTPANSTETNTNTDNNEPGKRYFYNNMALLLSQWQV